ncbi:DUF6192 family protein, partial [Streptomyces sp. KR55]|uniref:DUF6192 family protein n=1 Tax=Streptomyces sp. KR55 TaxID=3457425 RepID=UPI003FD202E5
MKPAARSTRIQSVCRWRGGRRSSPGVCGCQPVSTRRPPGLRAAAAWIEKAIDTGEIDMDEELTRLL